MLADLDAPAGARVIMDRGIATEANLAWLHANDYQYIVVSRQRQRQRDIEFIDATTLRTADGQQVQLTRRDSDDGNEVRLYCGSEAPMRKETAMAERHMARFEAALQRMAEGLSRPRTVKRIDKLWERIGRLKEKSFGMGPHYHIELIPDETSKKAQGLHWQRLPHTGSIVTDPGVYCLRSNITDWDDEALWRTYMTLTDIEAVFRSLKSELGLRPIYHRKEERAEGHLFITVIAYQMVQIIRRQLAAHSIHERWHTLRDTLANHMRVTATFNRADGRTLHVRKPTQPEPEQAEIYQALGVDSKPGGIRKTLM
jgi:transposase